tara:strand:+ start:3513 stop:4238 length:726 start_codon:yes stop_codon:yes gene_type:complete
MKIVAIIPARGGSVGVPLKNIRDLNGKPLIEYTIESALSSGVFDRVIVSTDHQGIKDVSLKSGAEVPFTRPANISEDVETELVLQHAVSFLESKDYFPDAIALLQPTSPFRSINTMQKAAEIFKNNQEADSVVAVNNVEGYRPEWMLKLGANNEVIPWDTPFKFNDKPIIKLVARQSFPSCYKQNGVFYLAKRDLLMDHCLMIGENAFAVETSELEALDIDTELDFKIAEVVLKDLENSSS